MITPRGQCAYSRTVIVDLGIILIREVLCEPAGVAGDLGVPWRRRVGVSLLCEMKHRCKTNQIKQRLDNQKHDICF